MSKVKLILVAIMLMVGLSTAANAQVLICENITPSPSERIEAVGITGQPGSQVWIPFSIATDSAYSGFNIIIRWDEQYLSPVLDQTDPNFVVFDTLGALADTLGIHGDPAADIDGNFFPMFAQLSQNPFDSGAIVVSYNTTFVDTLFAIEGGLNEVAFRLAFNVDPSMPHDEIAGFYFHDVNEVYLDSAQNPVLADCRRTQISLDYNGLSTVVSYPETIAGIFRADTAPEPIIAQYSVTPDTINTGGAFQLNWAVSNADWIKTFGPNISEDSTAELSGDRVIFTGPTLAGVYWYFIEVGNTFGVVLDSVQLVVTTGGGGGGNTAPVITGVNGSYTVDIGSTLNIAVTATDANAGDIVTLQASALPTNATFDAVTGVAPVTSTFSFTPTLAQAGNHTATFQANDASSSSSFTTTIIVNEPQSDKLFSSSVLGSSVGGIPSKEGIVFPINLITANTVFGVQFDFLYDADNFAVTDVLVTPNTADYVIYENIGQTPGTVKFVAFGMSNQSIGTDGTEILQVIMEVDELARPGLYPVTIEDAWESIDPDPTTPGLPLETEDGLIQVDGFGDVNLDTRINVADLVSMVGYIIGDFGFNPRRLDIADVVADAQIDVFDLVAVVNLIYGIPLSPSSGEIVQDKFATIKLEFEDIYSGGSDILTVHSEMPVDVAGVELDINYDPERVSLGTPELANDVRFLALTTRDNGAGNLKALLYFTNPFIDADQIAEGSQDLLEIPVNAISEIEAGDRAVIDIRKAKVSTSNSMAVKVEGISPPPVPGSFVLHQNYPNPFNPHTTIGFTIDGSAGGAQEVKLEVYNILGQNVNTLIDGIMSPGDHEVVWDGDDKYGSAVATGIYLYKLQVGSDSQTKKMLLLK